jgi:hypothetical protein
MYGVWRKNTLLLQFIFVFLNVCGIKQSLVPFIGVGKRELENFKTYQQNFQILNIFSFGFDEFIYHLIAGIFGSIGV